MTFVHLLVQKEDLLAGQEESNHPEEKTGLEKKEILSAPSLRGKGGGKVFTSIVRPEKRKALLRRRKKSFLPLVGLIEKEREGLYCASGGGRSRSGKGRQGEGRGLFFLYNLWWRKATEKKKEEENTKEGIRSSS